MQLTVVSWPPLSVDRWRTVGAPSASTATFHSCNAAPAPCQARRLQLPLVRNGGGNGQGVLGRHWVGVGRAESWGGGVGVGRLGRAGP